MNNPIKLTINGEEVLQGCYNCGAEIMETEPFMIQFDPGEQNYPVEPDVPSEYYFVCKKCILAETYDWEGE
jgi:hypothetical protein